MKRILCLVGGVCWFLFALGFLLFLIQYLVGGAGSQFFGPFFSSSSVVVGMVHVVGLIFAVLLCFAVGAGLCAHGLVGKEDNHKN